MSAPAHCTFCDIIRGAAEVSVCYEDAHALAFMDIQPVNPGHVLVAPKVHYESLLDLPPETASQLYAVVARLAPIVRNATDAAGMNIIVSSGAAAGQDVYHFHIHLIPRREGDGFEVPLPFPGSTVPARTALDAMAARIIGAFRDPMRKRRTES
jgi:histidine triad (HIT) family protein